ncbi:MAG: hypothetical protein M0R03_23485 [Novosphingobium sp.]|jgi:DnaJ-class molecular chaperone|nr:hypothetical protein [Novosphingobium sp.]
MDNIIFFECPSCNGYGKKDNGNTCKKCKGSGELMFTKGIAIKELQ